MSTKCTIVKSFLSTQHYFGVCMNVKEMMRFRTEMQEPSANVLRKNEPKNLQILCGSAACQEVLSTGSTRTRTRKVVHSCLLMNKSVALWMDLCPYHFHAM